MKMSFVFASIPSPAMIKKLLYFYTKLFEFQLIRV